MVLLALQTSWVRTELLVRGIPSIPSLGLKEEMLDAFFFPPADHHQVVEIGSTQCPYVLC